MKLIILYLSKKYAFDCIEDSFEFLSTKIAQEIGVPIVYQKLIFKGKSLHFGSLSEQGLKNNEKVMLIGNKAMDQSDADALSSFDSVEKTVADLETRLDQIHEEFSDYSQGFVPADLRPTFLRSLIKRVGSVTADSESCQNSLIALLGRSTLEFADRVDQRYRNLLNSLKNVEARADSLLADLLYEEEPVSDAEDGTMAID